MANSNCYYYSLAVSLFSLLDFYLNYAHTTHARPEWILQASNDLRLRQVCLHATLNLCSSLHLSLSPSLPVSSAFLMLLLLLGHAHQFGQMPIINFVLKC